MTQLTEADYNELVEDANRFRGLRLLLCEPNKEVQGRMLDAVEKLMDGQPDFNREEAPTPERVTELVDALLLAAAGAHNA